MKIAYKTKKWDNEVAQSIDFINAVNAPDVSEGQPDINFLIEEYNATKCDTEIAVNDYRVHDVVSLYYLIGNQYYLAADTAWMVYENAQKSADYLYLYLLAKRKAYDLQKSGVEITNPAVAKGLQSVRELRIMVYSAIAIGEAELFEEYLKQLPIIYSLYNGDYETARVLVNEIADSPDEAREVYYRDEKFLKNIFIALLDRNEKLFNEELIKRIKKLRRNMVDYLTVVDITSIAIIKLAEKCGLSCNFDIIEIPKYFFSRDFNIDKQSLTLPCI